MIDFIQDALTEDELDVLNAKFRTAIKTSRKVENDLDRFIVALDDDWPYSQRMTEGEGVIYGSSEWFAWIVYVDGLENVSVAWDRHRATRLELSEILRS